MIEGAREAASQRGLAADDLDLAYAPGAFELPIVARAALDTGRYDGVVALGCIIQGETPHFHYVADAATHGLNRVALDFGKPVGFGVLTVDESEHAVERAGGSSGNKGVEAMDACLDALAIIEELEA